MKVYKDGYDWVAECKEHDQTIWCEHWIDALEAAYGHVAMRHPRDRSGVRSGVERVLREHGLSDDPAHYDSSIHSWRCEYPGRYGFCSCFDELVRALSNLDTSLTSGDDL